MAVYYNEIDRFAAAWLRRLISEGLIADGEVDERSISDVRPGDLAGFVQCHFFAGIGGWSYALRLAGWPDDRPVWTGSCPCQGFSSAARGRLVAADLWPAWRPLILAARPGVVFGEQVASARRWFDGVCDDLEGMGYAVGAAILSATGVGLDHARPRIYFAGDADRNGQSGEPLNAEVARMSRTRGNGGVLVSADGLPDRVAARGRFGNAIVPPLAAAFIEAYCEAIGQ